MKLVMPKMQISGGKQNSYELSSEDISRIKENRKIEFR